MPVNAADGAWGFVNEVRLILIARTMVSIEKCRPLFLPSHLLSAESDPFVSATGRR